MDKIGDDISGFFTGIFGSKPNPKKEAVTGKKSDEMYPHFPHKNPAFTGIYTITFGTDEEGALGFEIDMGAGKKGMEQQIISSTNTEGNENIHNNTKESSVRSEETPTNNIQSENLQAIEKTSTDRKVMVNSVAQGSLAHHKGIQIGDLILKVDGNEVHNIEAFLTVMEVMGTVRPITIEFERTNVTLSTGKDSQKSDQTGNNAFSNMNDFFAGITNIMPQQGGQFSKQINHPSLDIPPEERRAKLLKAAENRNKAWDNKLQKNREMKAQKDKEAKEKLGRDLEKLKASQKEHMKNRKTEEAVNNAKAHEGFTASKLGYNPYEAQIRGNSANATGEDNKNNSSSSNNITKSCSKVATERRISSSSSSLAIASGLVLDNDQTMTTKVHDELEIILSIIERHDHAVKVKLFTVLTKILSNILNDPENEKYLKVRLANPNIHSAIVSVDGGMELMHSCGFDVVTVPMADETEETEEFLLFRLEEPLDTSENVSKLSKINIINKQIKNFVSSMTKK